MLREYLEATINQSMDTKMANSTILSVHITDYRYKCVSKKGRVETGQYFDWIECFTT